MKKFIAAGLLSLSFLGCTNTGESPFTYSDAEFEAALTAENDVLLDFFAEWCPSCKANQPRIDAAIEAVDNENLVHFVANYDDSQELQQRFGIILQSSYVFIPDGDESAAQILGPGLVTQEEFEAAINQ